MVLISLNTRKSNFLLNKSLLFRFNVNLLNRKGRIIIMLGIETIDLHGVTISIGLFEMLGFVIDYGFLIWLNFVFRYLILFLYPLLHPEEPHSCTGRCTTANKHSHWYRYDDDGRSVDLRHKQHTCHIIQFIEVCCNYGAIHGLSYTSIRISIVINKFNCTLDECVYIIQIWSEGALCWVMLVDDVLLICEGLIPDGPLLREPIVEFGAICLLGATHEWSIVGCLGE